MTSRDQFEQAYADYIDETVERIRSQRLGSSYSLPRIASAWIWWQRGKEAA
ncbi:hypothetical protein [Pseudomonas abietaniphila]|jgi:hypothetical protein|uniref:hypothetical protein n=1 Tax=Pseudomonas abietaniphila TaxID=89065 RepID=UPI000AAA0D41|nr:hypothetical protein [Pseudomonas abietaniphila]